MRGFFSTAARLRAAVHTAGLIFNPLMRLEVAARCHPEGLLRFYSAEGGMKQNNSEPEPAHKKHWTDGKVREILENQNLNLWIRGIEERIKSFHLPEDSRIKIVTVIRENFVHCLDRHQHRITDERSSTHLQTASLVAATHKVLMPFIRNEEEVKTIIKGQMGETVSPMLKYMLTGTLYFSRDPFLTTAQRLKTLKSDLGDAVTATIEECDSEVTMRISSCLYNEVLAAEEVQHLADCCCCSVDAMWFDNLQRFGVEFKHEGKLSDGDSACCYTLSRQPKT